MPYTVDRYRSNAFNGQPGWPLVINDSNINSGNTSLKIIGRGIPNYGEFIAENFVHILENFAGTVPPDNPITGQIWFETNPNTPGIGTLRVYNGVEFSPVTGGSSGATFPTTANIGQIHLLSGRLFVFNGTNWIPFYQYSQGSNDPTTSQLGDLFFNTSENAVKIRISNPTPQWRTLVSLTGGDSLQNNNLGVSNNFYLHKSVNANISAVGTSESQATTLTNNINIITAANATNRSVRFDVNANVPIGTEITVVNDTNENLLIFPRANVSIDDLSGNEAFALGPKARVIFVKASSTKFYSITSIYA